MNTKYDPEDIEYLLRSKPFEELYPDEKAFVLRHVEDQAEYDSLRKTLTILSSPEGAGSDIEPRESTRAHLLTEFDKQGKRGFVIWLNSVLAFNLPNLSWHQQPGYRLAMATVVLLIGAFFVFTSPEEAIFAEHHTQGVEKESSDAEALEDESSNDEALEDRSSNDETVQEENESPFAEASDSNEFSSDKSGDKNEKVLSDSEGDEVVFAKTPEVAEKDLAAANMLEDSKFDDVEPTPDVGRTLDVTDANEVLTAMDDVELDTDEIAYEQERRAEQESTKWLNSDDDRTDDAVFIAEELEEENQVDKLEMKELEVVSEMDVALAEDFSSSDATNFQPGNASTTLSGSSTGKLFKAEMSASASAREVENLFDQLYTAF